MTNNNVIRYFFCASFNGVRAEGLFGVNARNYGDAYRNARKALDESLKKLPGTLKVTADIELVYTNANEIIERAIITSIKKYGTSNVCIASNDSKNCIEVLYSASNKMSVFASVSIDDFIMKNDNIDYESWIVAVAKQQGCKCGK